MKEEKQTSNWPSHIERVILIFTLIGGFYLLDSKIENLSAAQTARLDQVNTRTDQLYTMFIDLVKENKK